ncbi:Uncharacterised protein [Salmonella enterica]|nr:Uncharacterised protein [Salmonella enterica]
MDEQRTTNVLFQRVQRLGGAGDVTLLHKHHEDGELAEGNVIGDRQVHRPPRALVVLHHLLKLLLRLKPCHFTLFQPGFGAGLQL